MPVEALKADTMADFSAGTAVPPTAVTDANIDQDTAESTDLETEATKTRTMLKFQSNCWTELSVAMNDCAFLALDCAARIRKPAELRQRVRFEK